MHRSAKHASPLWQGFCSGVLECNLRLWGVILEMKNTTNIQGIALIQNEKKQMEIVYKNRFGHEKWGCMMGRWGRIYPPQPPIFYMFLLEIKMQNIGEPLEAFS